METEPHADSGTETESGLTIRLGSSRSSTISNFWRKLDEWYSQRSDDGVQESSSESDEDTDVRPDSGIRDGLDAGETVSESGGETRDQGESDSPTEPVGQEVDAGATGDTDNTSEPPSGTDVEQTPTERTEPESRERESKQIDSRFHFGALQNSRGDMLD